MINKRNIKYPDARDRTWYLEDRSPTLWHRANKFHSEIFKNYRGHWHRRETQRPPAMGNQLGNSPWEIGLKNLRSHQGMYITKTGPMSDF